MWSTFIHLRLVLSCYPLSLWQWSLNWNNTLVLQAAVEVSEKCLTSMEWFPTFLHLPLMRRVAHLRICIFLLCHSVNAGVSCEDIIRCLWFVLACFRVLDLEHRQLRPKLGMFLMQWNLFFFGQGCSEMVWKWASICAWFSPPAIRYIFHIYMFSRVCSAALLVQASGVGFDWAKLART